MNTNNKTSQKRKRFKKPSNFAEALLELDGRRAPPSRSKEQNHQTEQEWLAKSLKKERHQEVISTPVFNREDEEVKAKIVDIQEEMKKLVAEMATMGAGIEKAINQQIVNPGTYHISFFEALRRYLIQLRKKASESKNWLSISQQRKQSQNYYWSKGVKKGGTSFMMSQERAVATQAG